MKTEIEFNFYKEILEKKSKDVFIFLEKSFQKVTIGAPNPQLISHIKVNFYDVLTPINEIAAISAPAPLQLLVKPYEIKIVKEIASTIVASKIDAQVQKEANQVRLIFPEPTQQKRQESVSQLKKIHEEAKVRMRLIRQDVNKLIKKEEFSEDLEKDYLNQVQKNINSQIEKIDELFDKKVHEIQTI
ncbi:ribosome recycling factor [Mycoplasma flocculare]|uniref:Ribosome recycling factor n=2 Tax=Mesomycoplasma flocculare TaxID=2128 RepID=A0A0A8E646_MESFC|nr:ribosome-recycling factor [Mesomycoplasma flocculare]MXR39331.1 ribosome recycling factor [Mycoplasma sp. MF12]AJC49705.1 ribosome recycling factor [Mesomycoplasma flocculare ATCC 27399]ENX51096.1 ribosome recycling factor [Mesomycoplasma flocculare ATCC 27716]MXR05745.1 ribosome recycling factor [Mesomycoplasma flocculare]MXR12117.1 ribosome recycling factor [Mesomycoplasma flocculare]